MLNAKILLWRRGQEGGRSFCLGLEHQTPRQAAELCRLSNIEQITPEGGVSATNRVGANIVILDCNGPTAVDITYEALLEEKEEKE